MGTVGNTRPYVCNVRTLEVCMCLHRMYALSYSKVSIMCTVRGYETSCEVFCR